MVSFFYLTLPLDVEDETMKMKVCEYVYGIKHRFCLLLGAWFLLDIFSLRSYT